MICHAPGRVLALLVRACEPSESQLFPEPATRRPGDGSWTARARETQMDPLSGGETIELQGPPHPPEFAGVSEDGRDRPRGSGGEPPRT